MWRGEPTKFCSASLASANELGSTKALLRERIEDESKFLVGDLSALTSQNLPKIISSNILLSMKRFLKVLIIIVICFSLFPSAIQARARRQPRRAAGGSTGSSVQTRVFLVRRGGGRALLLRFSNLNSTSSVSYSLTYSANGILQGVGSFLTLTGTNADSRELLFGTCSGSVCVYHKNITDIKLTITSTPKTGTIKQVTRSYRKKRI
jgi:hypothetical protein